MQRVLVIGIPGAGKSTFAVALAQRTGLPLIHLDKEFWQPGWRVAPEAQWLEAVARLAARPSWIMDGNYDRTFYLRMPRADTLIWFDTPRPRALWRVFKRSLTTYGLVRSDMAPGCPEKIDPEFWRYVWRFNAVQRARIEPALAAHGAHLSPVIIRHDADAAAYLASIGRS